LEGHFGGCLDGRYVWSLILERWTTWPFENQWCWLFCSIGQRGADEIGLRVGRGGRTFPVSMAPVDLLGTENKVNGQRDLKLGPSVPPTNRRRTTKGRKANEDLLGEGWHGDRGRKCKTKAGTSCCTKVTPGITQGDECKPRATGHEDQSKQ